MYIKKLKVLTKVKLNTKVKFLIRKTKTRKRFKKHIYELRDLNNKTFPETYERTLVNWSTVKFKYNICTNLHIFLYLLPYYLNS